VPSAILGLAPFIGPGNVAAMFYRSLVGGATLQDLPDAPRFVFNSAHLASGTSWRFSKPYMGSYRLGLIGNPRTKVAVAMAASAAFPPVLAPVILRPKPEDFDDVEGADLYADEGMRKLVALADGGVYDNLGLETVQGRYNTLLVSDASGGLAVKSGTFRFWPFQLMRVLDTATEQARALRRRDLKPWREAKEGRRYAFWATITDLAEYPAATPFTVHNDWRFEMASVRTRLNRFSEEEQGHLVNWGYVVSDVALRSFIAKEAAPPSELPFPDHGFDTPPKAARPHIAGPQ
jgi:NTE family protein